MSDWQKNHALKVYILWSWLERNPTESKENHPLWDELGYRAYRSGCAWCSVYLESWCDGCPLNEVDQACCNGETWYDLWWKAGWGLPENLSPLNMRVRKEMAGNIAQVAWAEYKRLGG